MKRVGIFSGTFDPVHKGHITFALQAVEAAELDELYFAPEVKPRRKSQVTHFGHRVAMLKLATRAYKKLKVLELPDRYFTAHTTLPKLQTKFPDSRIILVLGSDLFSHIDSWPRIETMIGKVGLVVGSRGAYEVSEALAKVHDLPLQPLGFHVLDSIERQVSSATIRAELMAGKSSDQVSAPVAKYVRDNWLYHNVAAAKKTKPDQE